MTRMERITPWAIATLAQRMDPADRARFDGDAAATIRQAAAGCVHSFAGIIDNLPAFVGGLMADGRVWMVSTPDVAKARKFYLRATRAETERMQTISPVLWTYVDARYPRSLRWLAWLGFSVGEPVEILGTTARKVERRA